MFKYLLWKYQGPMGNDGEMFVNTKVMHLKNVICSKMYVKYTGVI